MNRFLHLRRNWITGKWGMRPAVKIFCPQKRYIVWPVPRTITLLNAKRRAQSGGTCLRPGPRTELLFGCLKSKNVTREECIMTRDCTNGGCACTPNQSIKCTVNNCAHHCQDTQYCGLNTIQVGTHETNPTMVECTDCQSFKLK